jgi:hypothetical protein
MSSPRGVSPLKSQRASRFRFSLDRFHLIFLGAIVTIIVYLWQAPMNRESSPIAYSLK